MPTLHDLQSDFRRFLTGEAREQLLQVVDGIGFDSESRLSIYRNNTTATLTAALKATFPVICRLVDGRFFDYAAHAFIQHNLPTKPCLVEYGGDFPTFLAGFPPAADLDYLPDVARLEWAINRVLRAPQPAPPISLASLLAVRGDPAQVRLRIAGCVEYVASPHPIHRIWQHNRPGVAPMEMVLDRPGAYLEIHGVDRLQITDLPPVVWTFRSRIADGAALGAAAAGAISIAPDFDLAPALAALFNAGLISAIL
jgi:putative DNA-binding protein